MKKNKIIILMSILVSVQFCVYGAEREAAAAAAAPSKTIVVNVVRREEVDFGRFADRSGDIFSVSLVMLTPVAQVLPAPQRPERLLTVDDFTREELAFVARTTGNSSRTLKELFLSMEPETLSSLIKQHKVSYKNFLAGKE